MKHILVTGIDDRLIHGQVMMAWVKWCPIDKILIIGNELSGNKLMGRIHKTAVLVGIEAVIMGQEMVEGFLKEDPGPKENLMILVKVPQVLEKFIGSGISIGKIILGGMRAKPGGRTFNKNVSANEEGTGCSKRAIEGGVEIYYQLIPSDKEVNIRKMLS